MKKYIICFVLLFVIFLTGCTTDSNSPIDREVNNSTNKNIDTGDDVNSGNNNPNNLTNENKLKLSYLYSWIDTLAEDDIEMVISGVEAGSISPTFSILNSYYYSQAKEDIHNTYQYLKEATLNDGAFVDERDASVLQIKTKNDTFIIKSFMGNVYKDNTTSYSLSSPLPTFSKFYGYSFVSQSLIGMKYEKIRDDGINIYFEYSSSSKAEGSSCFPDYPDYVELINNFGKMIFVKIDDNYPIQENNFNSCKFSNDCGSIIFQSADVFSLVDANGTNSGNYCVVNYKNFWSFSKILTIYGTFAGIKNDVLLNDSEEKLARFLEVTTAKERTRLWLTKIRTKEFDDSIDGEENWTSYTVEYDGEEYILTDIDEGRIIGKYTYLNYSFNPYSGIIYYLLTNDATRTGEDYFRMATSSQYIDIQNIASDFPLVSAHKQSEIVFYGNSLNEQELINYYDGNTTKYYYSHYTATWMINDALYDLHYQLEQIVSSENEKMISFNMRRKILFDNYQLIDKDNNYPWLDIHYEVYLDSKFVKMNTTNLEIDYTLYAYLTDGQIAKLVRILSDEREKVVTKGEYNYLFLADCETMGNIKLELLEDNKAVMTFSDSNNTIKLIDGTYIVNGERLIINYDGAEYAFYLDGYVSKVLKFDLANSKNVSDDFLAYVNDQAPFKMELLAPNRSISKYIGLDTSCGLDIVVITRSDSLDKCILLSHDFNSHNIFKDQRVVNALNEAISIEEMIEVLATYPPFELNFINIYVIFSVDADDLANAYIVDSYDECTLISKLGLNKTSALKYVLLEPVFSSGMIYGHVGNTLKIWFNLQPDDYVYENVYYKSSNPSIVTIDANGNISFVGEGVAYILVSVDGVLDYYPVKVGKRLDSVINRYLDCDLTNEEQEMIGKSFIAHKADLQSEDLSCSIRTFYGKYNGYYAVIVDGAGLGYDEALWTDTIDGVEIHYCNGNQIYLINEYNVLTLKEGFEAGIINHNDLEAINSIGDLK